MILPTAIVLKQGRRLPRLEKTDANVKAGCEPQESAFDLDALLPANLDLTILEAVLCCVKRSHCHAQGKLALTLLKAHKKESIAHL
eukprot:3571750-Pleurochrysis_carterae.AAC.1